MKQPTIPSTTGAERRQRGLFCREDGILFLTLLGFKGVYLLAVLVAVLLFGDMNTEEFYTVSQRWPPKSDPVLSSHFATWDSAHYLFLSREGYTRGKSSSAFYPLWPLLIRHFSVVTGGDHLIAGLVLANIFSAFGLVVFSRCVRERFGIPIAKLSLAILLAFPGSLFLQFGYSESLFFCLMMLFWMGIEEKLPILLLATGFLLPLARPLGILCVFPLTWQLFRGCGGATRLWSFLLMAPLLGWGCYFGLMWAWTGNAFEGFSAAKLWRDYTITDLFNIPKFLLEFFSPTQWHGFSGSTLDRCVFLLLLACLPVIWRCGRDLLVWALILGVVPAITGLFASYTRFLAVVFPVFIGLAFVFNRREMRWPRNGLIMAFLTLQGVLLWCFVNFRWAG